MTDHTPLSAEERNTRWEDAISRRSFYDPLPELRADHEAACAEVERLTHTTPTSEAVEAAFAGLYSHHLVVEDCWYSCPASGDCCRDDVDDECNCGADTRNAHLSTLRSALTAANAEVERERMRLAACGTAALGYFDGCADEYRSASLDDVLQLRSALTAAEERARKAEAGMEWLAAAYLDLWGYAEELAQNAEVYAPPMGSDEVIGDSISTFRRLPCPHSLYPTSDGNICPICGERLTAARDAVEEGR